jgi:hypothetical protein
MHALPQQYVLVNPAFLVYKVDAYFDLSFTTSAAVVEPSDDEVNGIVRPTVLSLAFDDAC